MAVSRKGQIDMTIGHIMKTLYCLRYQLLLEMFCSSYIQQSMHL